MKDEVQTVVRRPLAILEAEIRKTHGILAPLTDVSVDNTFLTFVFSGPKSDAGLQASPLYTGGRRDIVQRERASVPSRQRRRRRKRNRIRTAGWEVLAKFTNSKGLRCNIYKPFYEALRNREVGRREASLVALDIIKRNHNPNPSSASVEYFLDNTLEYLKAEQNRA